MITLPFMQHIQKQLDDILEIVTFIRDNGATKEELSTLREDMQTEFAHVREEIITHVDGFIGLHQKLDTELA